MSRIWPCLALLAALPATLHAQGTPAPADLSIIAIQRATAGQWQGQLEYRDYQADRWFGIPMQVSIEDQGDGATIIRKADFDDGPRVGNVRITSISLFSADGSRESVATFRKGREPDLSAYALAMPVPAIDVAHWTIVATVTATDDDRPALLRETTTRDGNVMTTLKEVDFLDDAGEAWIARNRTTLTRIGDPHLNE